MGLPFRWSFHSGSQPVYRHKAKLEPLDPRSRHVILGVFQSDPSGASATEKTARQPGIGDDGAYDFLARGGSHDSLACGQGNRGS